MGVNMRGTRRSATTQGRASSGRDRHALSRGVPLHGSNAPRRLLVVLAAITALLLAVLAAAFLGHPLRGYRIDHLTLVGEGRKECVRVYSASDVSGSMDLLSLPRNAAQRQARSWLRENMRTQDQFGSLVFGSRAQMTSAVAPARQISTDIDEDVNVGGGTQFHSVLDLFSQLPRSDCRTALILFSDGAFADMPPSADEASRQLREAGVDSLDLLVPSPLISVPAQFQTVYGVEPQAFNGLDADETSYILAQAIARATGQALVPTR